jgi:uncharacterized membrane protein YccC
MEGQNRMTQHLKSRIGEAFGHGFVLAVCCLISFEIATYMLANAWLVSRDDILLGGMWAVVATIFVFRYGSKESAGAAISRASATLLSFALCFLYLLILPFQPLGMVVLIGIGAIVMSLIRRTKDIVTTGITTAVVMVVAGMSPEQAWRQPILRLIDTVVGILVGIAGVWIITLPSRSRSHPAKLSGH